MSGYLVSFNSNTSDEEIQQVKDHITQGGGVIGHEYNLIKGFSFTKPEVSTLDVGALSDHPAIDSLELDQTVTTQ
ncbi:Proteinase inhibitor propeptide [Penicillium verhagenii]|uniref:Proteinase inhibitor propeptide n=1 Tax=Penicillium verhagenii TaxID=1562060 RepID=UPI0025456FF5|nr:Proteinase inhibitor propeptide [Penicillium verhagenii]KAJ5918429.1 Proteinase inhibitor propeptide [Penicillium verhagenii]KAJ5953177.1 Proteinase inhibitor propeptide [Penicillium verhagenii]